MVCGIEANNIWLLPSSSAPPWTCAITRILYSHRDITVTSSTTLQYPHQQVSILQGSALGLTYLHGEKPPVDINLCLILPLLLALQLNFKSNLLDKKLSPKIGFSAQMPKCVVGNITLLSAKHGLPGVNGYRLPKYADCKYTQKSCVFIWNKFVYAESAVGSIYYLL